jgi:hypothetical protein
MPVMQQSHATETGYFIILGDPASDIVAISGTFTGDVNTTTMVVNTSAGLGADTHKGKFLYITSGACSGVRSLILVNTDTSITVPLIDWRTTLGAIANGDTFSIKTPGTVINVPVLVSGQAFPGMHNCTGGGYQSGVFADAPQRHWIIGCAFTGAGGLAFKRSAIALAGCTFTLQVTGYGCDMLIGGLPNGFPIGVGTDTATNKLLGYGVSTSASVLSTGTSMCFVNGLYSSAGTFTPGATSGDVCYVNGCRLDGSIRINGARVEGYSASTNLISKTIVITRNGFLGLTIGTWTFAVTVGQCLLAQENSTVVITTGVTLSGGTTDAASVAMNAVSAGRIILVNRAPVLTGVGGADIKAESSAAIDNATLSANGLSTVDAATLAVVMRVLT